jgi:hypothetical protein
MLLGEIVAVYSEITLHLRYRDQPVNAVCCENHTEHTDTVRTSRETQYVSSTEPIV